MRLKMNRLNLNKNNTYIVMDFDKTITSYDSSDSWDAVANPKVVGQGIRTDMDKLYKKYRPIEMDYTISKQEKLRQMEIWYSECMNLYYKYNLTKEQIKNSIQASDVKFRKGAKELLILAHGNKIPVIILSAGIGNTIEQFLKDNNCLFDDTMYIISNFIEFDENGKVKKFDNSKMIHTLNKTMDGHLPDEFMKKLTDRQYKILIGDLLEDIKMVDESERDTTLRIGILTKEMENEENLKLYNETFDIVLTEEESLLGTCQIVSK
mgnify:CR=1 FL=1